MSIIKQHIADNPIVGGGVVCDNMEDNFKFGDLHSYIRTNKLSLAQTEELVAGIAAWCLWKAVESNYDKLPAMDFYEGLAKVMPINPRRILAKAIQYHNVRAKVASNDFLGYDDLYIQLPEHVKQFVVGRGSSTTNVDLPEHPVLGKLTNNTITAGLIRMYREFKARKIDNEYWKAGYLDAAIRVFMARKRLGKDTAFKSGISELIERTDLTIKDFEVASKLNHVAALRIMDGDVTLPIVSRSRSSRVYYYETVRSILNLS